VERHAEHDGESRREVEVGALQAEALALAGAVGLQLLDEDVCRARRLPLRVVEQVVRARERQQSRLEALARDLGRQVLAEGLPGDRLDGRERVLDAVVEFVDESFWRASACLRSVMSSTTRTV
jgi:hypothetical protein